MGIYDITTKIIKSIAYPSEMVPPITEEDDGHHHFDPETEHSSMKLGMWLFLATELLLFGGLFAAYAIYRAKYPEMFMNGSKSLDVVLGTVNTVILIFSSLTVAIAVKAIQENRIKLVKIMLWITIVCAAIFAVNKYFEYYCRYPVIIHAINVVVNVAVILHVIVLAKCLFLLSSIIIFNIYRKFLARNISD